jgi:rod shape-determining protein MreD
MAAERRGPWPGRALYLALSGGLVLAALLPLSGADPRPGPDLLLALTLAFVLRRPAIVPPVLVVLVFLLADLAWQRPPGLGALAALLVTEALRSRAAGLATQGPGADWLAAALGIAAFVLGTRMAAAALLLPVPALGAQLAGLAWTIAAYPLVALFAWWPCRVRKPEPSDSESRRLTR